MQAHYCQHAAFDGGPDDPRTLVCRYQQELRGHLLAKAASEQAGTIWWAFRSSVLVGLVRSALTHRPALSAGVSG
jgi:hypothetical protein